MKNISLFLSVILLACSTPAVMSEEVSSQKTAAIEELLKTMRSEATMNSTIDKQKEAITKLMNSLIPKEATPEVAQQFHDKQTQAIDNAFSQLTWDKLKPAFVKAYSDAFTDQEIKDLTAFFQTPAGQKFALKMMDLQSKTAQILQKQVAAITPELKKVAKDTAATPKPSPSPKPSPKAKASPTAGDKTDKAEKPKAQSNAKEKGSQKTPASATPTPAAPQQ